LADAACARETESKAETDVEIERAERVAAAWLAQLASRHGHNKTHCIPFRRAEIVAR